MPSFKPETHIDISSNVAMDQAKACFKALNFQLENRWYLLVHWCREWFKFVVVQIQELQLSKTTCRNMKITHSLSGGIELKSYVDYVGVHI